MGAFRKLLKGGGPAAKEKGTDSCEVYRRWE